jgi:hypothetical protein
MIIISSHPPTGVKVSECDNNQLVEGNEEEDKGSGKVDVCTRILSKVSFDEIYIY